MKEIWGVLVLEVQAGSLAEKYLQVNDVILQYNARLVNNLKDLLAARRVTNHSSNVYMIFRNQREVNIVGK